MKKRLVFLCLLCILILSGCTVTANRIYTICKDDNGVIYCYNNQNEFYKIDGEVTVAIKEIGVKPLPALVLNPSKGDYVFDPVMPGLYKGTLEGVNHYVYRVSNELSYDINVTYRDWNNIECFIFCDEFKARIIFNIKGDVRIYFIDSEGAPMEPLYL